MNLRPIDKRRLTELPSPLSRSITNVAIRNFKSIGSCNVRLHPLTILVGPNASGKSNFLEAIDFVSESLDSSLETALRQRGGINEVRRRSFGHPNHFRISLSCRLSNSDADYSIELAAVNPASFTIKNERCQIRSSEQKFGFEVSRGDLVKPPAAQSYPRHSKDRLYLTKNLGNELAEELFDFLTGLRFYDFDPGEMRELQPPDVGDSLAWDGWNLASVWRRMKEDDQEASARVEDYLANIAREISGVNAETVGPKETLRFLQRVRGAESTRRFFALSMSEGTIRAFGILVALFQSAKSGAKIDFVAIEEPEKAIYPGAMTVIYEAVREASANRQVIITSHSPELLDSTDIDIDSLLAVSLLDGSTSIGRINDVNKSVLRDRLYTAGDLLRMDQLAPAIDR